MIALHRYLIILICVFSLCDAFSQGLFVNQSNQLVVNRGTDIIVDNMSFVNLTPNQILNNEGNIKIINGDLRNFGHIKGNVHLHTIATVSPYLGDLDEFEMDVNGELRVQDDCSFYRLLKLTNGLLLTNNFDVILRSNVTATALVHDNGGATIGDVTVQRYLNGPMGHHFLSSPTSNATIQQLADDINLNLNGAFPYVYYYDETLTDPNRDLRWVAPVSSSYSMSLMQGITFYFNGWNKTVDIVGPINTGQISYPLTFTQSIPALPNPASSISPEGWNFVGNPYPSPIDFNAVVGTLPPEVDASMYRWDPSTKSYISYVNGISSNTNFNGIIPSMQGFWVRSSVSTIWQIDNVVRVTNPKTVVSPFLKQTQHNIARLSLSDSLDQKLSVIYFDTLATDQFDKNHDAYYLASGGQHDIEFATVLGPVEYSINALPENYTSTIPLYTKTEIGTTYTIQLEDFIHSDPGVNLWLTDNHLGVTHNLNVSAYSFTSLGQTDRFFLQFSGMSTNSSEINGVNDHQFWYDDKMVYFTFDQPTDRDLFIRLSDALGQIIDVILIPRGSLRFETKMNQIQTTGVYYLYNEGWGAAKEMLITK